MEYDLGASPRVAMPAPDTEPPHPVRFSDRDVLSVEDAAAILRISPNTLYERLKEEERVRSMGGDVENPVPFVLWGRRKTIPADMLHEWLRKEAELCSAA